MTRRSVATALAAVLGIAVSAALAFAASQLAGQRVGLSSEPLSVVSTLSPRARSTPARPSTRHSDDRTGPAHRHPAATRTPAASSSATTTTIAPASAPAQTGTVATTTVTTPAAPTATTGTPPSATRGVRRLGHNGDGGDRHDD
jgi:ATP-dependent DNA helicase RecG